MSIIMRLRAAAVILGLVASASGRSEAAFIMYTESAVGSGSLGGTAFTNALVTLTGTADTNNVTNPSTDLFTNPLSSATVTVAGVGTATFTDAFQITLRRNAQVAGFGDLTTNAFVLGNTNAAFATYDLRSPIGPLTGPSVGLPGSVSGTTSGSLVINSAPGQATFTASPNAVPEPSSLTLCVVAGLAGLGCARVGRK